MKNLVLIALVLVSVSAQAKGKKMTAEYKAAKAACLAENKDLKGKALKECITSKETAAPAGVDDRFGLEIFIGAGCRRRRQCPGTAAKHYPKQQQD
jgi:hypothetical protein